MTNQETNPVFEPTRIQQNVIEEVAELYGGAQVRKCGYEGACLVIGMTDDVERCHLYVAAHPSPLDPCRAFTRGATREEIRKSNPRYN